MKSFKSEGNVALQDLTPDSADSVTPDSATGRVCLQAMTRKHYVGIGLGTLHLVIVLFATYTADSNNLPWVWMLLFPIDFPFSLLTVGGLNVMQDMWGDVVWDEGWKHIIYNYWPVFVHGLIGSLWWCVIPIIVSKLLANKKPE